MTTGTAGRSKFNRRRAITALGTVTAVSVGVGTVLVGAQLIGVPPPANGIPSYCLGVYQCSQSGLDPLTPNRPGPLVAYNPAVWNSSTLSGPVASLHTAAGSGAELAQR